MYDDAVCLDTSPPRSATSVLSVAKVDSLRASDSMTALTFSGSRREPSTRDKSSSATISMYRLAIADAARASCPTAAGHPPRTTHSAIEAESSDPKAPLNFLPEIMPDSLTAPLDFPSSKSVMVSMHSLANLPAPLCIGRLSSRGVADPVNMNWPGSPPRLSHSNRAASQSFGTSCHSSISRGTSPETARAGSVSARKRFSKLRDGSMRRSLDAARVSAVVVFPHHFGPSMRTAPNMPSSWSSSFSIILV